MLIKDYYKILDVPPSATLQEIKRSFRSLAQQYHPDKNDGRMAAHYSEIQEAYKVLSDPRQREEYNYKRWFNRSSAQPFVKQMLTPVDVLQECRSLQRYVASMNIFHVKYETVSRHIEELFSKEVVAMLLDYNDVSINHEIIKLILQAADPLPLEYFSRVVDVLRPLGSNDFIEQALKNKKQRHRWERYKWVLVVLVTTLILVMMYWVGK